MSSTTTTPHKLDGVIFFLLLLTAAVVPLVYYNNPIATEYFYSKAFFADLFVYTTGVLFFVRALLTKQLTIRWGLTFLPLALFVVVAFQSLAGAPNPWKGWETIVRVGAAIPFLFLLFQETSGRERVIHFLRVVALTNIVITAYGFLQFYEVFPLPRDQYGTADPSTTIGLTNFVMEYMSVYFFVVPAMMLVEKRAVSRALFALATLFQIYYFLISDNRAAMVGLAVGLGLGAILVVALVRRQIFKPSKALIGATAAALVLGIVAVAVSPLGPRILQRAESIFSSQRDDAITFRLETYRQTFTLFLDNPIRGVGLSNIEVEFPRYMSPFLENMTLKKNTRVTQVHDEYLQVLGDLGIVGGIAFGWFLINLFRLAWRAVRSLKTQEEALLVSAIIMGLAAYLVICVFAFPLQVPSSALSFFLVVGLLEVLQHRVLAPGTEGTWTATPAAFAPAAGIGLAGTAIFGLYATSWMYNAMHADVYFKEARIVKEFGADQVGKQLLDDAIRLYPQNEAYYYDRAYYSLSEGDTLAALQFLGKTASLVPNYAVGRKQIGLLSAQLGNFEKAAREFEVAFSIYKSQYREYVPLLVNAYMGAGMLDKALETAEKPIKLGAKDPELSYQYGRSLLANRRYAEAVSALNDAITLKPDFLDARIQLGATYVEAGRFKEAVAILEPIDSPALTQAERYTFTTAMARSLFALGQKAEAVALIRGYAAGDQRIRERLRRDDSIAKIPEFQTVVAQ